MRRQFHVIGEVAVARIAPGAINVISFILLANSLSAADYGVFSTVLATAGFVASVCFGPIKLAVIPQHAEQAAAGRATQYERAVLGSILLIGVLLSAIGFVGEKFSVIPPWFTALALTTGLFASLQPILQARTAFWSYGAAAVVQAVTLLIATVVLVRQAPTTTSALAAYAISTFAGLSVVYILIGRPAPMMPQASCLKSMLRVGVPFTSSMIAESVLLLGFRYALLGLGTAEQLGAFSLAADISQRTVGALISITSFAILPRAYRAWAERKDVSFRRTLTSGALSSAVAALLLTAGVLVVAQLHVFPAFSTEAFTPVGFALVALAVISNRLRKMLVDPIAVSVRQPWAIVAGYVIVSPVALSVASFAIAADADLAFYGTYLCGYLAAAAITVSLLCQRRESNAIEPR